MGNPSWETGNPEIVLRLLTAIERDSAVTQRKLASELGIALGLANLYLRRCVNKGLVKIGQVPLHRYAYYLTPQGFTEKSRLAAEYLAASFIFFRRARSDCASLLHDCVDAGWRRVALCGTGELAEIAVLTAQEATVEIVCVIDSLVAGQHLVGLSVVASLADACEHAGAKGLDGVIVTDTRAPQTSFDAMVASALANGLARSRVVAPIMLGISLNSTVAAGEEAAS